MWDMTLRQFLAGLLYLSVTVVALLHVLEVPELSGAFWFVLGYAAVTTIVAAAVRKILPNRLGFPPGNLVLGVFLISFFGLSFFWLLFLHPLWLFIAIPLFLICGKAILLLLSIVAALF